jgi:hypothetical protein
MWRPHGAKWKRTMNKYIPAPEGASGQLELIPAPEDLPEFDWNTANDSIVLQEQPETAVYLNPQNVVVIIRILCCRVGYTVGNWGLPNQ